jgi:hypothetical protein
LVVAWKSRYLRLDAINIPPGRRGKWREAHRLDADLRRLFYSRHIVRICSSGNAVRRHLLPATGNPI